MTNIDRIAIVGLLVTLGLAGCLVGPGDGPDCPRSKAKVAQRFDPAADEWLRDKGLPRWDPNFVGAEAEGFLYLSSQEQFHRYDPTRGRWERLADRPSTGVAAHIVGIGKDVYVLEWPSASETGFSIYDAATDTWSMGTVTTALHVTSVELGGSIYAMGGPTDALERSDPVGDQWSPLTAPPSMAGEIRTAEGESGWIYAFDQGGEVWVYDTLGDAWSPGLGLSLAAGVVDSGQEVFIVSEFDRDVYAYHIVTGSWRVVVEIRRWKENNRLGTVDGLLYVMSMDRPRPC